MDERLKIMITKSDLGSAQGSCNHTDGNGTVLNNKQMNASVSSTFTHFEPPSNDIKLNAKRQKVMLCNGHREVAFQSERGGKDSCGGAMEVTTTNGRSSPIPPSGSKDSGFSTPATSTSSSSRTATPCNSDHMEPMETTESTLAAIASTPLKDVSATYSASIKPCTASNIIEHQVDEDQNDVFFFESDHAALKGNLDYQNLLKTVTLLESQRTKAISDLDKLIFTEKEALSNPVNFVQRLQRKVDVGLPPRLPVATIPKVQWDKYTSNLDPLNLGKHNHMTRKKKLPKFARSSRAAHTATSSYTPDEEQPEEILADIKPIVINSSSDPGELQRTTVIRGRVKDEGKPQTFNELWTPEEQHRLEALLLKHPAEEVEAKRWAKIAEDLGNRTRTQVQTRVQKYFIKLAKAGLPIPGRMPNMQVHNRKNAGHRPRRYKHYAQPASTFMQSVVPPVFMSDAPDDYDIYSQPGSSTLPDYSSQNSHNSAESDSEDDDIPVELKAGEEYEELIRLKRLRREKMKEEGQARHIGFKCDRCDCDPIVGTRWHCLGCPPDMSTDFCSNCFDSQFQTESHNSTHALEPISVERPTSSTVDRDYTKFMNRDYNYLDPNYMPAS